MRGQVTIVVPTINEAGNLPELISRIGVSLKHVRYEVLVVDDGSTDGTLDVCERLASAHPVTGYARPSRAGGLAGAVLYGFSRARGDILGVMDADLQHPPEALPTLLAPVMSGRSDFAIGSRRAAGSTVAQAWGPWRRANSTIARWLAAPLVFGVRDPLSGFFVIRRAAWEQASGLNPLGYKIALELLCKCPATRVTEIPIHFGARNRGSSKLSLAQRASYVIHLTRLYASYLETRNQVRAHPSQVT